MKKLCILGVIGIMLCISYILVVFFDIPPISTLRDIYIETAMTTGESQWLATLFFPEFKIKEVMSKLDYEVDEIGGLDYIKSVDFNSFLNKFYEDKEEEIPTEDLVGNPIYKYDKDQGIIISEISTSTYVGKVVLIDDPSRISIVHTRYKGQKGEKLLALMENNDAIVGINANGFIDDNGQGSGGHVVGLSMSSGELWGQPRNYSTVGFTKDNRLVVGKINNWDSYDLRDGAQFSPVLVLDGKKMVDGSAGWGVHPRTAVGQLEDGTVIFIVIDGRKVGYSIGITVGELADIMLKYGAVNASCLDGGSSSILGYDGEIISVPSSKSDTGRYLPNAFIVKRK